MKLSILTATYNRANYLTTLYESMKKNIIDDLDIEWIVVDDGSTDDTKWKIKEFEEESIDIEIKYIYQENMGNMAAINKATEVATGEIIVDCDSDDFFTEDSFKTINKYSKKLFENKSLYGLVFLKKENNGEISGKTFKKENAYTTMFELYFKEDIAGEKIIVYNSEIRKKYKHRLEKQEKFVTEARMFHEMDEKYKLYTVNFPIEQGSYQEGGYTKNIVKTYIQAPYGYYMYFKEILSKKMDRVLLKKRIYVIKHYILFGYLTGNKFDYRIINGTENKILYVLLYIPGIIKSKKWKKKVKMIKEKQK